MKPYINTHALNMLRLESARLGPLGMIAHRLSEEGLYEGAIIEGRIIVGRFQLTVSKDCEASQVDLDLARLIQRVAAGEAKPWQFRLGPEGYMMLFLSHGAGGYRVVLEKAPSPRMPEAKRAAVFDSETLGPGDLFIATLLRPGRWRVTEATSKTEGEIQVAYPKPAKTPLRPGAEVTTVKVTDGGFKPAKVKTGAAQGVIFAIESKQASLVIDLVDEDNGPTRQAPPKVRRRVRWQNPRSAPGK